MNAFSSCINTNSSIGINSSKTSKDAKSPAARLEVVPISTPICHVFAKSIDESFTSVPICVVFSYTFHALPSHIVLITIHIPFAPVELVVRFAVPGVISTQ